MQFDPHSLDLGREPKRHFALGSGTDLAFEPSGLRWGDAFFRRGASEIPMERVA